MAERKIGAETYKFDKLPALPEGIALIARVAKFLGPAWGYLDTLFDADESRRDNAALSIIAAVSQSMDVNELVDLLTHLCELCQIKLNGAYEPVVAKMHLRGELDVFRVAVFVLEVQCRDFFGEGRGSQFAATVLKSRPESSAA